MDDERTLIEKVLKEKQRRLGYLELEKARKGFSTDPAILIEIDDLSVEVKNLQARLANTSSTIGHTSVLPPSTRPDPAQVTLRFEPTDRGAKITWEGNTFGRATSEFVMPYTAEELPIVIKALDAAQYPDHPTDGPRFSDAEQHLLTDLGLWKVGRVPLDSHQLVGKRIYQALIQDSEGKATLRLVRESARNQGQALSYILRFPVEAVDLASLPWEAMRDERQAVLLSRGGNDLDSLERYLDLSEALSPPLPPGKKLHILVLSPQAGIPEDVRQSERTARLKSWEKLKAHGLIDWDELSPVTTRSLNDRMRNGPRPDIIHYYGHGGYKDGQGYLVFDNTNGYRLVDAHRLAAQLGGIRLIMIHACQSAMLNDLGGEGGLLTGVAPALSAVSEAVVAMQLTVRISAATRFSEVFYEEIARGRSLQAAVAEGRRAVYLDDDDDASWYVPTLYIRTQEQRQVFLVQPTDEVQPNP